MMGQNTTHILLFYVDDILCVHEYPKHTRTANAVLERRRRLRNPRREHRVNLICRALFF